MTTQYPKIPPKATEREEDTEETSLGLIHRSKCEGNL